ncbi:MAG: sterol desaturase family protein [Arenicella sp.]|jgi:sterol desaturase/sphingolipid hydroxylase (fatty acid hydroxylase superfamily)|nr:sterol desaturase family protein [Arenicella sp.]
MKNKSLKPNSALKSNIVASLAFPLTMSCALFVTWYGSAVLDVHHVLMATLSIVIFGFIVIPVLERRLPFRQDWSHSDGDVGTDWLHMIIANGIVVNLEKPILVAVFVGATAWLAATFGSGLWPDTWPLLAQLLLMLLIAEFGRYWVHFAAHKIPWLWRLHAIHHSPNRLYFLNAGRFHPLEKVIFQLPEVVPFILLGTNIETIALYATFNAIHGFFQHSNIQQRLGWLNYVFSLPELHRWHHSKNIEESDRNFGNNLIIWDLVFGTYFNPKNREVDDIGLLNTDYPKGYLGQLKAPFAKRDISKPEGYVK